MDALAEAVEFRLQDPVEAGPPHAQPCFFVERVDLPVMVAHQAAWADLASRTLEPNVFLDAAFALPLVQQISPAHRPSFLLAWEQRNDVSFGRLAGLLAVAPRRLPGDRLARGFVHDFVCLGVPLLDAGCAGEAWAALLAYLGSDSSYSALSLTSVPNDGAFFRLLVEAGLGTGCRVLGEHSRACLHAPIATAVVPLSAFRSAKRRKEMRRQQRRLAELGRCEFISARTPEEVRRATERFLLLEARGWKGGRGSALLAHPRLATFARAMTRLMAHEGKCRIDSLEVDGHPVAMGIVLEAAGRAHFWKTAFDESYGRLSPGVQLALQITDIQLSDPRVATTDSCAAPDHPMIDRLWPDRMALADVLINLRPGEPGRFARVYAFERFRRAARQTAKTVWKRIRRPDRKADAQRRGRWSEAGNGSTSSSGSPGW